MLNAFYRSTFNSSRLGFSSCGWYDSKNQQTNSVSYVFGYVICAYGTMISLPMWEDVYGNLLQWEILSLRLHRHSYQIPWKKKHPQAVFRGGARSCFVKQNGTNMFDCGFYSSRHEHFEKCGRFALLSQGWKSKLKEKLNIELVSEVLFRLSPRESVCIASRIFKYEETIRIQVHFLR